MVDADTLAPIWRQGICNYLDDARLSAKPYNTYD